MSDEDKTKDELIEELQKLRSLLNDARHERKDRRSAAGAFGRLRTDDYLAIFDAVNDAIFIFDPDTGAILDANQKMCETYGYTRDEMRKMSIGSKSAGIPPYTQKEGLLWIEKAKTEGPQYFEWLAKDKSNRLFWVDVNLKVAVIGGRSYVLAVVRDITERKQVQQELNATRDYLKTVFNNMHDAIFVHDLEGKVVDVNQKTLEMYRISREEAMDSYIIRDYSAPDNPIGQLSSLWEKVMSGENQFFEWKAKRPKDGSVFDVEVFLTRVSLPHGDFILANVRDITQRKRFEQELHATRDYLRIVFNNVYDAMFIHDLHGKVLDVNDKMLEMYRVSREEAIQLRIVPDYSAEGRTFNDLLPVFKRVLAGENQFFEWKARRPKDGSIFDVEVFLTRVSLPDGDFILGNVRDITQRKRVEHELQATRDYLRTVFNNVYDAIFFHDANGKVLDVNDKMLEMYRVSREEAIQLDIVPDYSAQGHTFDDLVPVFKRVLAGENQFFEWKAKRPKDGSIFDVEVFLTKVSLPHGDFILGNVRDITERKRMEKLLIKEKEVFFSVMNHNPHGIALFDNDGRFVYFNPEFTNITGYTIEDVPTGRDWVRRAYPDPAYRGKVVEFWKADRLQEGRGKDVEWRIVCKNGQHKDVEFRVTYLGDKSLVVLTDTTARKRAEEELQAEKQKFQTMAENSPMGMMMISADDAVRYVNPKFRELFGYDLPDVPNMREWFALVYPDLSYRLQAIRKWGDERRSLGPGEGRPYIRHITCRDGSRKHINVIPVQLETGEILITCEDITKSKEAEDKIRERNLELEVLNDIISSVSSSLHMPEILETLKKVFVEKLRIPSGGIFIYDESSDRLGLEMCWGIPEAMGEKFESLALRSLETAIHNDDVTLTGDQAAFPAPPDFLSRNIPDKWQHHLSIPLLAKGEMQGLLFLVDEEIDKLRDELITFYKTLGQQIGVATQNARLFDQVRQSHAQMKTLSFRLVEVQEAERRHIARELHDEIGQELTGLKLALEMAALESGGETTPSMGEAKSVVNRLVALVREMSLNLRPAMLDDLGLLPTLPWHFERFAKQTGIRVAFKHSGLSNKRFPMEMETTVYRIIQEALTNVARHAKVNEAVVRLWSDEATVGVQIEDSGVGFDGINVLKEGNSNGLQGMRERTMLLGGVFTLETEPGSGTRVTAEIPARYKDEHI